jgi:hypothetical protein
MSYNYGQPQRWESPDHYSRRQQAPSSANSNSASASSTRDDKKKKKDKNSKDKRIKVLGTKSAEALEKEIKANEMSPTIKYVELHRHGNTSWTLARITC